MSHRIGRKSRTTWRDLFRLLSQTEPILGRRDVEWYGPYFIPRPKEWRPTHFMLYGGHIYASMQLDWSTATADWDIYSDELAYKGRASSMRWSDPEQLWEEALPQLTRRLRSAVANPGAYNRRVERRIPLDARTGMVTRKWTWPRGTRAPLSEAGRHSFDDACSRGGLAPAWTALSTHMYLELAARLYDAAFPELRGLSPKEKHAAKADSRHGGMLDLRHDDPAAFREWFTSRSWSGCHPWEIVFGHPHGVLFSPTLGDDGTWRFYLSVDSLGYYLHAVQMAVALGEADVPFIFHDKDAVAAALRGLDEVEVGPGYGQFSVARFHEERPEGLAKVRWDPIPQILPISPIQRLRLEHVLQTGSPAGWEQQPGENAHGESP